MKSPEKSLTEKLKNSCSVDDMSVVIFEFKNRVDEGTASNIQNCHSSPSSLQHTCIAHSYNK